MDNLNNKDYQKFVEEKIPKPTYARNIILAFLVGGAICTIGEFIMNYLSNKGLDEEAVSSATSIIMVFLGALLTGLGIYDQIGKFGGAGAAVPITGFANSIVAPAMEFKKEGFIFGVASKMFVIAGPVLVYGVSSSIIVGILTILFQR
ncbi:stage V sporulation protein AC [Tissierella creatinophila]|uniref:SpoVA protein n=1 Tax=Tissierella creatinophila DSM 6911 TaxID=1123403 RepID=A0A1U7M6F2_TISCR|nr:stage V sporulation protein AC [Tissierella creatinophila]OLS02861.1 SpoVA protein [Tissierella creatinophila DSM 6911]